MSEKIEMQNLTKEFKRKNENVSAVLNIILIILIVLLITGCNNLGGNVKNVKTNHIQSNIYSKEDIDNAIDIITKEFEKDWTGCTLKEIYYSGDDNSLAHQDWADRNSADEVIVLLSTFDVDSSGGDGSLNPNSTYEDWMWILVRNKGEKWIHVDHGY